MRPERDGTMRGPAAKEGGKPVRKEGMSDEEWEELLHGELFREYESESRRYAGRLQGREETEADEAGAETASNSGTHGAPAHEETEGIGDLPESLFADGAQAGYSGEADAYETYGAWDDDRYDAETPDYGEEREDDTF